jgi:hypothetical protein
MHKAAVVLWRISCYSVICVEFGCNKPLALPPSAVRFYAGPKEYFSAQIFCFVCVATSSFGLHLGLYYRIIEHSQKLVDFRRIRIMLKATALGSNWAKLVSFNLQYCMQILDFMCLNTYSIYCRKEIQLCSARFGTFQPSNSIFMRSSYYNGITRIDMELWLCFCFLYSSKPFSLLHPSIQFENFAGVAANLTLAFNSYTLWSNNDNWMVVVACLLA